MGTGGGIAGLLGESELFGEFPSDVIAELAKECSIRRFDRNHRVFGEGDEASELYVVRSGRVAISNRSVDGRESVVALMEEGDMFGDMPLFDRDGRSAEARALEPSELVLVPYPPIQKLFTDQPSLLWEVVRVLSKRLRNTDSALADSVFLDVPGRTAKRLLELAGRRGGRRGQDRGAGATGPELLGAELLAVHQLLVAEADAQGHQADSQFDERGVQQVARAVGHYPHASHLCRHLPISAVDSGRPTWTQVLRQW